MNRSRHPPARLGERRRARPRGRTEAWALSSPRSNLGTDLVFKGDLPIFERYLHHWLVEMLNVRPCVADQDVEAAKACLDGREHAANIVGLGDVGLEEQW